MSGWKITGWGGVCGLGALSFLRLVAVEVERTERVLREKDAAALKAYTLKIRELAENEVPPVAQTVGRGSQTSREFVARN